MDAVTLRVWLWDGKIEPDDVDPSNDTIVPPNGRSSLAANIVIQAPFELLAISITLFLAALGSYLGLIYASKVKLSEGWDGNSAVLAAFIATAVFSLVVFGQALGAKDQEMAKHEVSVKLAKERIRRAQSASVSRRRTC